MNPEIVFGLEDAAWPALLVGTNGAIFRANPTALTFFGDILSGELPPLSALWAAGNESTAEDFIARWEQTARPNVHLKFKRSDGSAVGFNTAVSIFVSAKGTKLFVLQLVGQDGAHVDGRPAGAGATDTSGPVLKQKLECALQLARTVSLDFNNALTSILGHASFLLSKAEPGHPWRHSLMEVEKSAAAAAEIANELQVFSRQEKETRRTTPPGNLNVVVNRCVDFFRNSTGDRIAWNLQLEKTPFGVRFDEAKIQQAFTKILENAVESFPEGQRGQVTITTRDVELTTPTQDRNFQLAPGAYLCVEIGDNGGGIDAQTLPRIFEPFFTTKKGGHRGLGLALVYGIVTNHGGGVAISSEPGKGTSARVYLPAEKQTVGGDAAKVADLRGTQTVLVVDDEDMLLTMTDTILADYGYTILTANSGQRALSILARPETKVDLIITDLVMPGMGGRELIDRIKQMYPNMKIICMSGYTTAAEKTPVPVSLRKPFTSVDLLTKVKQAMG